MTNNATIDITALNEFASKKIKELHMAVALPYKPVGDDEITMSDIEKLTNVPKNIISEVFEKIVITNGSDDENLTMALYSNAALHKKIQNIFEDNKIRVKIYNNKKYKYSAEYRVEITNLKKIFQEIVAYKILSTRNSNKKVPIKNIRVTQHTYVWLTQTAHGSNKTIGEAIDELVIKAKHDKQYERVCTQTRDENERVCTQTRDENERVCTQTRDDSNGVNNVSSCKHGFIGNNGVSGGTLNDTLNGNNDTLNDTLNGNNDTLNDTLNGNNDTLNDTLNGNNDTLNVAIKYTGIIAAIRRNPKITAEKLSEELSTSVITIKRYISYLKKSQTIRRTGSKKSGQWEIIKNKTSNIHYEEGL